MRDHWFEWKATEPRDPLEPWSEDMQLECALSVYQQCVDPLYRLDGRPDRSERNHPAIDGIFACPEGRPIGIEITSLPTFAGQLKTQSLFNKYLLPVEKELAAYLPLGVSCCLPAHPFVSGSNWNDVSNLLASHITSVAGSLEPGAARHEVASLPFQPWLAYDPYSPLRFYFTRSDPTADEIRTDLLTYMVEALRHKQPELQDLMLRGYRTTLFLSSSDRNFYRLTWDLAYRTFLQAEGLVGTTHVTDVLFAFTGDYTHICCVAFKGDPDFRNALNSRVMKFGPEYSHLWLREESANALRDYQSGRKLSFAR